MIKKIDNIQHNEVSWNWEWKKELNELKKNINQQNNKVSPGWNKKIESWTRTVTFENWDTYAWQYVNGKKEWQWTFTWKNVGTYKWEWKNDSMEWQWTFTWENWDTYTWEWKSGRREWQWTFTWANWNIYTWEWKNNKIEWQCTLTCANWNTYTWEWKNNKIEWQWTYTYANRDIYKWDFKNGKKEWQWTYTWKNWITYTWEFKNGVAKECKWTLVRQNWDKYVGDVLIDNRGVPIPFYKGYKQWRESQIKSWNPEIRNMQWKYTSGNGFHEYKLTNWSITEKSNDFITMYGDKKPDENRSPERGNIEYTVNYHSANNIEYKVSSWKWRHINRKFDWKNYIFKDSVWKQLKIPSSSNFGEKAALHAANLINCIRYFNETKHWNGKYRYDDKNIYSTLIYYTWYSFWWWISYHETRHETNGTNLCEDIPKHFWWIKWWQLGTWLNNAKW